MAKQCTGLKIIFIDVTINFISCQCSYFISPENTKKLKGNTRKTLVFWYFQLAIKWKHWFEVGYKNSWFKKITKIFWCWLLRKIRKLALTKIFGSCKHWIREIPLKSIELRHLPIRTKILCRGVPRISCERSVTKLFNEYT